MGYSENSAKMNENVPIYNSRVTKLYLRYLGKHYPDIDFDSILDYAGMPGYAVEDQAHWFSQKQVDRFQKIVVEKTGNPDIAREAGRYGASSEALGAAQQYTLGLLSLTSVYMLMGRVYTLFSRGATVTTKKLGRNKVEIVSTPNPGVNEKPYQCENRIGLFESVGKLFTQRLSHVDHPNCYHKGNDYCRYLISWETPRSLVWKRLRNYSLILGILASFMLYFILPITSWPYIVLPFALLTLAFSFYSAHLEKKDLVRTIETQGDAAKDLLEETNIRYNKSAKLRPQS